MTPHKRRNWRQVNLIVFANDIGRQIRVQSRAALRTNIRTVIDRLVRGFMQSAAMALVTGLRTSRLGLIPPGFPVRRGRLGGSLRRLGRALQIQHDLYKLLLAQLLKGIPIHFLIDSEITKPRKGGLSNYSARSGHQNRIDSS
jgi:hypothetical protein